MLLDCPPGEGDGLFGPPDPVCSDVAPQGGQTGVVAGRGDGHWTALAQDPLGPPDLTPQLRAESPDDPSDLRPVSPSGIHFGQFNPRVTQRAGDRLRGDE